MSYCGRNRSHLKFGKALEEEVDFQLANLASAIMIGDLKIEYDKFDIVGCKVFHLISKLE